MELFFLGNKLQVNSYQIQSILYDHREINEAGYQLLLHWRQQGIEQQKEDAEMKQQLKTALEDNNVNMKIVVAHLKSEGYF